jgi:hypothetical protein
MKTHAPFEHRAGTDKIALSPRHRDQAPRKFEGCIGCGLAIPLHFSGDHCSGRFIGCAGAAIADRIAARAQQSVAVR